MNKSTADKNAGNVYEIQDVSGIFSPGLIIFRDLVESNLQEMIRIAGGPERLCPHCKTHKTREIVQMMRKAGITHQKCATIAEAQMLAEEKVEHVFIAYQMVGPNLKRVVQLIDQFPETKFALLVDHPESLEQLIAALESDGTQLSPEANDGDVKAADASAKNNANIKTPASVAGLFPENDHLAGNRQVSVLIDLDSGMNRTGIAIGETGTECPASELYEMIVAAAEEGLIQVGGLHWYDGHNRQTDLVDRKMATNACWQRLSRFRDRLLVNGFPVPKIVAAGTGSFPILAEQGEPNVQLSPGTTTYHDASMVEMFPEMNFTPALAILTRVISNNLPGHLTLDVGHKACAADQPAGHRLSFPELPDAREVQQSEEHLVIATHRAAEFKLGDALIAIPKHACPTSAVHQSATVVSGGQVMGCWKIAARDRVLTI